MLTRSHLTQFLKAFLILLLLWSCGTTKALKEKPYKINFLDEYIIPSGYEYQGEVFGGISGIDYQNGKLILVNDSPNNPMIFTAELSLKNSIPDTLSLTSVTRLDNEKFFEDNALDMESIRFDGKNYLISTEGNINKNLPPALFKLSPEGEFIESYTLPDYFLPGGSNYPRHNGVFEGLSMDKASDGFWFANELPLTNDGVEPKLYATTSPIRLSHFDPIADKITHQYALDLDRITKIPLLPLAINGLTEVLHLEADQFLILERSYSSGHKNRGNKVKLFMADITQATNIKGIDKLKSNTKEIRFAQKSLLFDFETIKEKLTDQVVDNLEGLCFGPTLKNGNKTLIIISDDNFSSFGPQLNQVIILELIKNQ